MSAPRIIIVHRPKPIPDFGFDYEARWEGSDPEANEVGYGADEPEAEAALIENFPWETLQ